MLRVTLALALSLGLSACATAKLPLCPRVAHLSYATDTTPSDIGHYTATAAAVRGIHLSPLSAFAMTAHGSSSDIGWFKRNYREMLCAFNPDRVVDPKSVYAACMAGAPTWIEVVASSKPEHLMSDQYGYVYSCAILPPLAVNPNP